MKIVFLSRLFYPHIGGVEKHVEHISLQLIKQGHQVQVITTQYESSLKLKEAFQNIHITRIPAKHTSSKLKIWQWMLQHSRIFKDADIIHAHDVYWWYIPLRFSTQTPSYTTFHGWEGTFPPKLKAKIWRKLSETLSEKNICVGDYISKWYGANPDLVTYGATDQKPLLAGKENHITVLGRLAPDNDIHLIVQALKELHQKIPNLKVTFLGDGPLAFEAARVGEVLGFVDDPAHHIQESRWAIASSYLSILDAMAAGKKVFSVYSNPLKKDYLTLHPASKWFSIHYTAKQLSAELLLHINKPQTSEDSVEKAQKWAQKQTWSKLTSQYIKLWKNSGQAVSK